MIEPASNSSAAASRGLQPSTPISHVSSPNLNPSTSSRPHRRATHGRSTVCPLGPTPDPTVISPARRRPSPVTIAHLSRPARHRRVAGSTNAPSCRRLAIAAAYIQSPSACIRRVPPAAYISPTTSAFHSPPSPTFPPSPTSPSPDTLPPSHCPGHATRTIS
ncbi:uncharacterized protein SCHCODRAFT_02125056 [Schizophyllum commune H4-8]|uniref:uncharacterized protein n=1 Tax=Schizophyllum commune (strain H4-8 / FGSC 9210) TaxID=578458 RepID=UPI00215F7C84|nr:uncharacterized protein SCHCODRAFT_02125056 [Schizophyllum commune H4-8]KAI5885314.1 hypothetical protein SCHCODRAFT_02125056 [Schizophyllum commune H4-8]